MPNISVKLTTSVSTLVPSSTARPTLQPLPEHQSDEGSSTLGYIFVPIAIIAALLIASTVVLIFLRKRRIDRLRHHLMPLYNFDGTDDDHEDWEAELLDDISESRSLRRGYKSMEFPSLHNTTGFS